MDIEKQINDFCKDFNPEQKKLFFESFPAKPEVLEDMLADAKEHPALFEKIRLIMRDFRNNKENPEFWNLMEKYGAKEVILSSLQIEFDKTKKYLSGERAEPYLKFLRFLTRGEEGKNYRIRLNYGWTFPDGKTFKDIFYVLECPKGKPVALAEVSPTGMISTLQGLASSKSSGTDKKMIEAKKILGLHPFEFLFKRIAKAGLEAHKQRTIEIFVPGEHFEPNLNLRKKEKHLEYSLAYQILGRNYMDKTNKGRVLNPNKKRARRL